MADAKKPVEEITPMEDDFAQWYTDVVRKAELIDYGSVRGCMILRPYGYAIWENIRNILDGMLKKTGHQNVYMPLLIPESLLQKEKDHVKGFAPEVAWVTMGGGERLDERLCIRPTSETLFCEHYARIIHSYRDLPKLYNQWCNVMRWEKTTRPFLRSVEFLWQEGHTMHETAGEAVAEAERILDLYADFCERSLAMPVVRGKKTDKEKFAGARSTYTIEAMMHDGKSLQSGTSHYFGDDFARAFNVQFTDRNDVLRYPHQTSWGLTTRIIGAVIMTHGDDRGLVLPPAVAPVQVEIVPIAPHREGVAEKAGDLLRRLSDSFRCDIDLSDNSPGWKFAQHEMRGVPLRLEIGPRELEKGSAVLVRRDTGGKTPVPLERLESETARLLEEIRDGLFQKALANREAHTYTARDFGELREAVGAHAGFYRTLWCGRRGCEDRLRDELGITSRCLPLEQDPADGVCVCCGRPAGLSVLWGKAY